MNISEKEMQNLILKLPENIRQAVNEFDWATEIMKIAHAHYIQIDDIEEFHQETLKVILGISPAEDFEQNIINVLHINRETAKLIVDEANDKIFKELQRLAFNERENIQNNSSQEKIKPHHIKKIMSNEGIELIDEQMPQVFDNDLHKEVSELLGTITENTGSESRPVVNKKLNPTQKETQGSSQNSNNTVSYREPIEESDLQGIRQRSADISILKTQHQSNPEILLSSDKNPPLNKILIKNDQRLDKKIMEESFITQSDVLDISPKENETIKEEGSFLEHLSKEEI